MAKLSQDDGSRAYPHEWASKQASNAIAKYGSPEAAAFAILTLENVKSLMARYPASDEMWEEAKGYRFKRSAQVMRWLHRAPQGHGFLVGMMRGYAYQSCEHESWTESPAFQLVEQIKNYLLRDLESRDCKDGGMWACFTEPTPEESAPVSLSSMIKAIKA